MQTPISRRLPPLLPTPHTRPVKPPQTLPYRNLRTVLFPDRRKIWRRRLASRVHSTRRLARSIGIAHALVVWPTALAASNSERLSAALFSPRKSPRVWTALKSSSMLDHCYGTQRLQLTRVRRDMQNCFREHPDVYGAELEDDVETEAREQDAASQSSQPKQPESNPDAEKVADREPDHPETIQAKRDRSNAASAITV